MTRGLPARSAVGLRSQRDGASKCSDILVHRFVSDFFLSFFLGFLSFFLSFLGFEDPT